MTPPRMRLVAASVAAAAGLALAAGCGGESSREPAGPASAEAEKKTDADRPRQPADPTTAKVAKPDPALIGYDPDTRTLVLYGLSEAGAKWMLHLPDQPKGVPVNTVHHFMDEVDLDRVAVFYTTGSGRPSPRVTLRDVVTARDTRAQK